MPNKPFPEIDLDNLSKAGVLTASLNQFNEILAGLGVTSRYVASGGNILAIQEEATCHRYT